MRLRKLFLPLAAAALAGCQSASDMIESKIDYKSERVVQPLEIPPDLTTPQGDNRYIVPDGGPSSATYSGYQAGRRDPRAPGTTLLPEFDSIRVERAGNQRWLVVQESPEKLWPMVREFWQENGFLVKIELPEAGVLETEWAENRAKLPQGVVRDLLGKVFDQLYSTSERDKFRTRLERTPDGKGTEVYISHRGMQEVYTSPREANVGAPGQTGWTQRPADPELEAEFLRRLMARLGARGDIARQVAVDAPAFRASITKSSAGAETLQVLEPFDRAWRRVGLALDRVGFTVEDRDRQKGLYFVRYADPGVDSSPGFLSRLFSSTPDKGKPEQYRVQVQANGGNSQVSVLNKAGAAESSRTASRILSLLHEQLK